MKGLLTVAFTVAILASPPVWASTEIRGAGVFPGLDDEANSRNASGTFDLLTKGLLSAVDRADVEPFSVDETWLTSSGHPPKTVARHDRFAWTFLLIAFAGLTALFAGKRSGGRGLFGV
jgi:hypothetical protein